MLLKHWHFALIIFVFLTTSCEGDKNETTVESALLFPVGKEFNVSLDIAPFLEVDEQPLGRSVASSLPGGLYAVNVFWKGKSSEYNWTMHQVFIWMRVEIFTKQLNQS